MKSSTSSIAIRSLVISLVYYLAYVLKEFLTVSLGEKIASTLADSDLDELLKAAAF